MADNHTDYRDLISRRRFVALAGAGGATALAGCGGSDETTEAEATPTDTPDDDGGGGEEMTEEGSTEEESTEEMTTEEATEFYPDARHVSWSQVAAEDAQFNRFNPSGYPSIMHEIIFDRFAVYNFDSGELIPYGISDWEFTDGEFRMTVREGLTWSNGDPVTAEDIRVGLALGKRLGEPYADYAGEIQTDGERTVVVPLEGDVSSDIVEIHILAQSFIETPADVYQEYLDNFESMEEDAAMQEIQNFAYKEPMASGPFEIDAVSGTQLRTTRRDDHPDAGNINFGEYAFQFVDGNQALHQSLLNLDIDSVFSLATPPRIAAQFPDAVEEVAVPAAWGYGLVPNHNAEHVGERPVRQAIAHVINREAVVQNAGPLSKSAPKYEIGVSVKSQERFLGDRASDFNTYGQAESQVEQAAQLLESAGYSQDGGTWKDENGKTVSLPVMVPSGWTDWVTATETVVDQLSNAGFDAEVSSRSFGSLSGTVWPNADFKISAGAWNAGTPMGTLPYFSLRANLIDNNLDQAYNYPPAVEARGGSNADVTVPEIGGGGEMTVNPSDRIAELAQTSEAEAARKIAHEQAWVTNVDLPIIPVTEKQDQSFLTDDEWDLPEGGGDAPAAQVNWPNVWLPRRGKMNYDGD